MYSMDVDTYIYKGLYHFWFMIIVLFVARKG